MERQEGQARLPRGRGALPREQVIYIQRMRILDALVEVLAERGYGEISVGDVIAHAGVSRTTFYSVFGAKREAFLAARSHRRSTGPARLAWSLPYQAQLCLRFVAEHPGASSRTVCAGLGFRHLSQGSRVLAKLQRLELLHTSCAPRRVHAWRLTRLGEEVLAGLAPAPRPSENSSDRLATPPER